MGADSSGAMVGRTHERGVLERLARSVATGTGATALVEGEAGIGKTRLVQTFVSASRELGIQAYVGAARPFETTRAFGALAEALELRRGSSDPRRAALGRHLSGAGGDHETASTRTRPDIRHWVVDEIVDLVEVISADRPLLLVLEDLHWADESTILALRSMLWRLAQTPVLLLGTLRPTPRAPELDQFLGEAEASGATVLRLESLTSGEVTELVRAEVGTELDPSLHDVIGRAGGNPLWVVEILRSLASEGLLDGSGAAHLTAAALPDSFRQLVLRTLRYLPEATLATLRVAAVLGENFSLVDLATVSGRRALDVLEDLAPAVGARLLHDRGTTLAFRHELVYDAIYEDIPQAGRHALHRDAARVLADAGAPLTQIAAHVLRGAVPGDVQAVSWLRAAARDAAPRAPDVAIDMLEQAEALLPDTDPDRDAIAAELVEALLQAGRVADCAVRAEAVLARAHDTAVDGRVRLSLVSALSLQNRALELIIRAESALDLAELALADRALILAQASYGRTFSGDLVGGERTARSALVLARRSGDLGMTVWSLTTLSVAVKTQGRYTEAVQLTQEAVRLALDPPDEDARLRHPHFFLGMSLCDADRMEEARDAYRRALWECADLRSSWILPDLQQMSGELRFLVGDWDDALAELDAGLASAAAQGNRVPVPQSRGYQAVVWAARGDRRAALAALTPLAAELDSASPSYGVEIAAWARSMLAEAAGQPGLAFDLLWRVWQLDAQRQTRRYHRCLAPPLVRLALLLDRAQVARDVADAVDAAAAIAPDVASARSAALRCRGLIDHDPQLMLAAVELSRTGARFPDHASTCEDAASVLATTGRRSEARDLLVEALDRHDQLSATSWAARTRALLRELGVRPGIRGARPRPANGWESLTKTERLVAELVADGLTNREVGARLYISPHTVNTHMRHLFHKLGVSSRAALTATTVQRGASAALPNRERPR